MRGLAYLALTVVVAAVVAFVLWMTIGGSVGPPVPMLAQATILSVVVAFFLSIVWGGWPFSLIRNRLVSGLVLLVAGYVVAVVLFEVFFDYAWLKGAPVYVAALDPTGLFNAWDATVVAVTALSVMFLTLHLDLWPLTRSAALMKQPVLGLVWTALCLVVGVVLYYLGTRTFGMTPPGFLVTVPVPFIFGSVVLLNMLQHSVFAGRAQPVKGVLSAVTAMVVGTVLALLYRARHAAGHGGPAVGAGDVRRRALAGERAAGRHLPVPRLLRRLLPAVAVREAAGCRGRIRSRARTRIGPAHRRRPVDPSRFHGALVDPT